MGNKNNTETNEDLDLSKMSPLERVRFLKGTKKKMVKAVEWLEQDDIIEVIEDRLLNNWTNKEILEDVLNDKEVFPENSFKVSPLQLSTIIKKTPRLLEAKNKK